MSEDHEFVRQQHNAASSSEPLGHVGIVALILDDPVAIACVAVVMALFLCLIVALFVRYTHPSLSSQSSQSAAAKASQHHLSAQFKLKSGVSLGDIPRRCQCCMNPTLAGSRNKNKKPLPRMNIYIPEVTEKYSFKLWEAPEASQTSSHHHEDVL